RYQSAAEMRADLQRIKRDSDSSRSVAAVALSSSNPVIPSGEPATSATSQSRNSISHVFFRPLLVVPLLALLLVAATAFYFLRPPAPRLTDKDTIVIADFTNTTGDAVFDDTLKQALTIGLRQSPFLNILSDQGVRETLGLMGRPPGEHLTQQVAREICQRSASAVVIEGSISNLGSAYIVGLNAVSCRNGDSLAQEQAQAQRKEDVLKALGDATTTIRGKLGESLSIVQKFDVPLAQATTSSLEALKAFSLGREATRGAGGVSDGIPYYRHSIELDP